MTREQIEKRFLDSYDKVSMITRAEAIDFASEVCDKGRNDAIDSAIARVKQSMIGPVERKWILEGLESLKV